MRISKKRIRNLDKYLPEDYRGKVVVPSAILSIKNNSDEILKLGFSKNMDIGETVLPSIKGSVSRFNVNGSEMPDKTRPKETRYREIEWCWEQYAGWNQTETVCDFRMVPYERWPRIVTPAPSVQLTILKKEGDVVYITAPGILANTSNEEKLLHEMNLFLEYFGYCDILNSKNVPVIKTTISLNWTILPAGKRPWDEQKELLGPVLDLIGDKRTKPVLRSRLEDINSLGADFTAIGREGFQGYVIFGFSKKKVFVLESAFYGNAIYVFNEDWESLSKKSKAEILNSGLQIDRITHSGDRTDWLKKVRDCLK